MSRKYFGTDGVRGHVGTAPITPDFVMRLAYAAGLVLAHDEQAKTAKNKTARPCVLIGKDTRISGYMLEAAYDQEKGDWSAITSEGLKLLLEGIGGKK